MQDTSIKTETVAPIGDVNLDHLPAEALGALLRVELPGLSPAFGGMADARTDSQADSHALWARLRSVMDNPVQAFAWRGDKRVLYVLRHWVLVVWTSGRITALQWHATHDGELTLRPADPGVLDLFHLGSRSDWYAGHRDAARWERVQAHVTQGGAPTEPDSRQLNSCIFVALHPQVLAHVRHSRLDARIRAAMDLDADIMRWAVSLVGLKSSPQASEVSVRSYNWVVRQRLALEAVKREAPALVQWYAGSAQHVRFPEGGEAVQRVKRFLAREGVGRLGWLLALKEGHRIWVQTARWSAGKYIVRNAVDLLNTHALLGRGNLLPPALLQLWRDHWGFPMSQFRSQSVALTHLADLWRANPPLAEQDLADWQEVMNWFAAEGLPVRINAYQRRLGLRYFLRGANEWRERQAKRWLDTLKPLYVWHEPIEGDATRVEFMRTHRELIEEGQSMGNCLAGNRPPVSYDTLFGRVHLNGAHVGTALYKFAEGQWHLQEARGRFNSELSQDDQSLLARLGLLIQQPSFYTGPQWPESRRHS